VVAMVVLEDIPELVAEWVEDISEVVAVLV
jgi:hypothetical protein